MRIGFATAPEWAGLTEDDRLASLRSVHSMQSVYFALVLLPAFMGRA